MNAVTSAYLKLQTRAQTQEELSCLGSLVSVENNTLV